MNRQEYNLMVQDWNNFLLTEERILSEQRILLESIINEGFLEKLRSKGVKKSVATALLLLKMISIYPSAGQAKDTSPSKIPVEHVMQTAGDHGIDVDAESVEKAKELIDIDTQLLDSAGNPTDEYDPEGSTATSGLSATVTYHEAPDNVITGYAVVHDVSEKVKTLEKLRQLAQADIDEAAKRIGIRSISYGLHYLQTTNMVKFNANLEKLNSFIEEYKSGSSFKSVKKVSKFLEKQSEKEDFAPVLEVAFAYAAIKTCSDLPDACSEFKEGVERTTTQARYSGNVKGAPGSGEKITFQGAAEMSDRFAGHAGKIFKKNLSQATNALYDMQEQIEAGDNVSLAKIPGAGLVCGVVHKLITNDGDLDENKVKELFDEVHDIGDDISKRFETGQEKTSVDSDLQIGDKASNTVINTDNIIDNQRAFLDAELSTESLLRVFNII